MIKLKNDKGVTLIVLTITIIVLLIITGITINSSKSQLAIKKVSNLYSDIDSISTKVSDYYMKNNSLPIFNDNVYFTSSSELGLLITSKGGEKSIINPNDDGNYYVIDLSKLDNLTLNYGQNFKNWNSSSTFNENQDLYIINSVSHQIYYPKGIEFKGEVYFTKGTAEIVDKITTSGVSDDFSVQKADAIKNKVENTDKVIINADVILNMGENYNKDTLQFAWEVSEDSNSIEYTPAKITSSNTVSIMSKQMVDSNSYVLYFKVLDVNGTEHIINQTLNFN